MQPQDPSAPHLSPDGFWWWNGVRWVPAQQGSMPPPTPAPPYFQMPAPIEIKPSPGLRPFLIVVLAIDVAITGLLGFAGTIGETQDLQQGSGSAAGIVLWVMFVGLFALAAAALVGVLMRTPWARWVALAAGIGVSFTCLGAVIGIPIIVAAARAPIQRVSPATSP